MPSLTQVQLLKSIFGADPPSGALVAQLRELCDAAFVNEPLADAVRHTIEARNITIEDLRRQLEAKVPTVPPTGELALPGVDFSDLDLLDHTVFGGNKMPKEWYAYSRAKGNEGVGWRDPSQVRVEDEDLVITALGMESGGVGHRVNITHGLFVVEATFEPGDGTKPCILGWPHKEQDPPGVGTWPIKKEYDLVECGGSRKGGYCNVHYGKNNSQTGPHRFTDDLSKRTQYACLLTPEETTYFVNGRRIVRLTQREVIADYPHRLGAQLDLTPEGAPKATRMRVHDAKVFRLTA